MAEPASPGRAWRTALRTSDLTFGECAQMSLVLREVGGNLRVRTAGQQIEIECEGPDLSSAREHLTWVVRRAQLRCQWLTEDRLGPIEEL